MKKVVSVLFILAIIVFSVLMVSYSSDQKPEKVLRHVVMFGFKPDVSEAQVKEVEDAFCRREGIGGYGVGLLDEIKRMGGMNR